MEIWAHAFHLIVEIEEPHAKAASSYLYLYSTASRKSIARVSVVFVFERLEDLE